MLSQTSNDNNFAASCNLPFNSGRNNSIFIFGSQLDLPITCNGDVTRKTEPQISNGISLNSTVNHNAHQDNRKNIPTFVFGRQSELPINSSGNTTVKKVPQTSYDINLVNQNAHQDNGKNIPIFVFGRQSELPINSSGNTTVNTVPQTSYDINLVNQNAHQDNGKNIPIFVFGRQSELPINGSGNTTVKTVPQTSNVINLVNQNAHQDSGKNIPTFVFGRQSELPINGSGNTTVKTVPQTYDINLVNQNAHQDNGKNIPTFVFGRQSELPINGSGNTTVKTVLQTLNDINLVNQNVHQDNRKNIPIFVFGTESELPINCSGNTTVKTVSQAFKSISLHASVYQNANQANGKNIPICVFGTQSELPINCSGNTTVKTVPQTSNGINLNSSVNQNSHQGNGKTIPLFVFGTESELPINCSGNSAISTNYDSKGKKQGNIPGQNMEGMSSTDLLNSQHPNVDNVEVTFLKGAMKCAEKKKIAGNKHFENENYEESFAMYDEAVRLCPKNPVYRCKRSEALFMLQRYEEALKDAQKATELDSAFPEGYISKAKCCIILGKLIIGEKAVRCASELGVEVNKMQSDIETCKEKYKTGLWAMKSNNYQKAVTKMDDCLFISPGCIRFKLKKAECLAMLGRYSEAESIVLTHLKLKDSDPNANLILGLCYYFQEENDQAFDIFEMLINEFNDMKAMEIYEKAKQLKEKKEKGNQAYSLEKWQSALDFYNEALAIDEFHTRVNAKLHYNKAVVYIKTDKLNEAVQALTAALKLDNDYSKALLQRANCYTTLGKYTEAVKDYEHLYEIDKSTENRLLLKKANTLKSNFELAEEMRTRGNECFKSQNFEKALKMYDEAVRLCPANYTYLSNRSATCMKLGRYREALADSRKTVAMDATFTKGYIRIVKCSVLLGELALGEHAIRSASELGEADLVKDDRNIIRNLRKLQTDAQNAMKADQYQRAIEFIDLYLKDSCFCSEMQLNKAECLAMLGRCQEAEDLVRSVDVNANKNYVLGLCRYFEEKYDMAFDLLKLAPDYTKAMDLLKKAKQLKEKWEKGHEAFLYANWREAIHIYNEGLTIDKNNRNVNSKMYFKKAVAHKNVNQLREAIKNFTSALELNETLAAAYRDRAYCYAILGEYEKVVPDYEELCIYEDTKENIKLLEDATAELKRKRKDYHYWLLGIATTASQSDIKKAYKKCVLTDHPDKHPDASPARQRLLTHRFRIKKQAYDILSDPTNKADYDLLINRERNGSYRFIKATAAL